MNTIDKTLDERGQRYGTFTSHAAITQEIKAAMNRHFGWSKLAADQREALEMIAHKVGRILNGDPNYIDSWHDIIGYTRLVEQRLEKEQPVEKARPMKQDKSQVTPGPLPTDGLKQRIDRAIADLSTLERELKAAFGNVEVEVTSINEETGRTD